MSFMDRIRGQFKEAKEQKSKEKTSYQSAYEKEKRLLQEERAAAKEERKKQKITRAAAKAKRDVRNPFYRRLAKKVGATTKQAIDSAAAEIGKQAARNQAEKDVIEKSRRKARFGELSKIAAKQEKAKVNANLPMTLREKPRIDLFGGENMNPLNSGSDMNPLGSSKQSGNLLSDFNPLGSSKSSSKKSKKYSLFDGL